MPKTTREQTIDPPPAQPLSESVLPEGLRRSSPEPLLGHCTEAELLGLMSLQDSEPLAARDAWSEMYRRHSRYVAAVVARSFGECARDADALSDVVNDVFRTVFDWAGRQGAVESVAERFAAPHADGSRRKVLGFHAVVARRLAARKFAVHGRRPREFTHADIDQVPATSEDTEPPPTTQHLKLEAVLELLSSDEAEALRVSLPWYQVETGEFSFPRGEAARVAASLGITPEALRQRRSRSLKHLQSLLGAK
jgi:DNA-directed RNA polymerase specialized sigma24 family protein